MNEVDHSNYIKIENLITTPLEVQQNLLEKQLATLQSNELLLETDLALATKELSIAKSRQLLPSTKGITELDRRTDLTGNTVNQQFHLDYLIALIKTFDTKIELGKALLLSLSSRVNCK